MEITHPFRQIVFLHEFTEVDALDARDRGYLSHVLIETADGSMFPVSFYDPTRLQQDLEEETRQGRKFIAEPGMIIIPEIVIELMEAAARRLCDEGFFRYMRPVDRERLASRKPHQWPP